jgi:diadenosine tetraphosphatase ApaH/serine/threonine PP2A family protein phosphatase
LEQRLLDTKQMKTAILSDIHANVEALEAVLRDIAIIGCQKIYCLGDVVGYGPAPNEACARVRQLGIETVQGNHDQAAALDIPLQEALLSPLAYRSLQWTRKVLSDDNRRWLRQLPQCIPLPDMEAGLFHASPDRPEAWEYITSRYQAWDVLEGQSHKICFIGHTHRPSVWVLEDDLVSERPPEAISIRARSRYLVNVGSVGQPRDRDPRCSYVLFDGQTVQFRRVDYEVSVTQRQIREQKLPDRLADRLAMGV